MADRTLPPFPRQATCAGPLAADLAVVWRHAESGGLWTSLFYETGGVDEPVRFLKEVDWEVVPPPGARPWIAAAVRSLGELGTAWIGWHDEAGTRAESLLREEPCPLDLGAADRLVAPPWVDVSGRLHQLAWREEGDGWTLLDHVVESDLETRCRVAVETLATITGEPLLAQVLPDADAPEPIVGWVEGSEDGLRVRLAEVGGMSDAVSVPVRGRLELPQRPALHRDPEGHLRFACLLTTEPTADVGPRLRLVEVEHRGSEEGADPDTRVRIGSAMLPLDPAEISTAAALFVGRREPKLWLLLLTRSGDLWAGSGRPPDLRPVRRGVEPSDELSVFTTPYGIYQVDFDPDGRPRIAPFPAEVPGAPLPG